MDRVEKEAKRVKQLIVVAVMISIFCLSSQTATDSRALSNTVLNTLREWMHFFTSSMPFISKLGKIYFILPFRKWAHFIIYLVLGFVSYWALPRRWSVKKRMICVVSLCFAYAITDEIHQIFVPGRACQMRDVLIDTLGSCVGMGIGYFVKR